MIHHLATRLLAIMLMVLGLPTAASATEEDVNVWTGQFVTVTLDKERKWFVRGEAQERFTEDADRLGQLLLRSLVAYRVTDRLNIGAGYAYIYTNPSGPAVTNEHRLYQELNFRLIETKAGLTLDSRSRLEQRMFEEGGETGWRYRLFLQLRAPIAGGNKLVAYTEPFIGLNETRFNRSGVGLWRNFVGVSIPIAKGAEIVPGYLNQYVVRNGPDRIDHIGSINVMISL